MSNAYDKLFDILYTKSFIYREDPPFKLVSGRESFYYFDCKATTLDPEGVALVGEVMLDKVEGIIKELDVQAIGGLTLGADPISVSTSIEAYKRGSTLSPLIIRKEAKKHGTQKWIEGAAAGVKNVIVIDDVITTGGSTITAIERMRESGLTVVKAAVLVDREEGGRESIEATGVEVVSLFSRSDFDKRRLG
ncbi:MAG: orotate phosphoribosyltransferase [bacterium]|nr:orotate phosphoribosyltransferase [bacterium]